MALISFGETPCALCQKVIDKDDDLVATSHFITDPADPLCRFSDAGMHRRCFRAWDQREAFIRRFNETVGRRVWGGMVGAAVWSPTAGSSSSGRRSFETAV